MRSRPRQRLAARAPRRPLPTPGDVGAALRAAGVPGVSILESGLDLDGLGRWSFVLARPLAVATARPGAELTLVSGPEDLPRRFPGDCLAAAARLVRLVRPRGRGGRGLPGCPFAGGALLALSYDLGRRLERVPAAAREDDDPPPDLWVAVHGGALAFDHATGQARLVGPAPGLTRAEVDRALEAARQPREPEGREPEAASPASETDPAAYRRSVATARAWIRRGDLFEVNLSRRWSLPPVDPRRLLSALRAAAPAPFMADLALPDRQLLSASPERFLSLSPDGLAATWPIKGTWPRGATPAEDARNARALLASEKDGAELAMIVDLARSDLGRVAVPGSVRVARARHLQRWPAVHHTVGVVEARLAPGRTWVDLVRATFPPGSVTGAPKVRSLEVIDALEPVRRGLYCGAFGWVGFDGAMDLAVAIRVAVACPRRTLVHAGGAVTLGSGPAAEERETRLKARALLRAARSAQRTAPAPRPRPRAARAVRA